MFDALMPLDSIGALMDHMNCCSGQHRADMGSSHADGYTIAEESTWQCLWGLRASSIMCILQGRVREFFSFFFFSFSFVVRN